MRNSVLAALALAVAFLAGCSKPAPALRAEKDRKKAPDFALKDVSGKVVKLSDYRGKVVFVNFWATWCGPCKVEIPWFIDFQQTYKDRNFEIVGISMDEDGWTSVKPYVEQHKINYQIVLGTEETATLFNLNAYPTTYVIDRDGRIAQRHEGLPDANEKLARITYQNEILSLLQSGGASERALLVPPPR